MRQFSKVPEAQKCFCPGPTPGHLGSELLPASKLLPRISSHSQVSSHRTAAGTNRVQYFLTSLRIQTQCNETPWPTQVLLNHRSYDS